MGGGGRGRPPARRRRPRAGHRRARRGAPAGAPRLRRRVGLLLLAVALLAGCGERVRLDALAAGPRVEAVRALAGDRLAIAGGREVRLAGVEAPAPGAPWGEAARAGLERLAAGRRVDLLYGGRADDGEGRALAQVRLADGAWLQAALLDRGLARVRPRPGEAALAADMLAHEARARAAGRGLWSDAAYRVRLPGEFDWSTRGLQLAEGRVRRVVRRAATVYLDFADDWRGVVSAEVPARTLPAWRAAGRTPEDLRGRLIRVRGPASGFHLTIETPEAVELLRSR